MRKLHQSQSSILENIRLDPHADTDALTPSADWIIRSFSKNFLESF